MDNCSAHHGLDTKQFPSWLIIKFLPPNLTSRHQPADQGMIANTKIGYKLTLLQRLLVILDDPVKAAQAKATAKAQKPGCRGIGYGEKPTILDAMIILKEVWEGSKYNNTEGIQRMWRKSECLPISMQSELSREVGRSHRNTQQISEIDHAHICNLMRSLSVKVSALEPADIPIFLSDSLAGPSYAVELCKLPDDDLLEGLNLWRAIEDDKEVMAAEIEDAIVESELCTASMIEEDSCETDVASASSFTFPIPSTYVGQREIDEAMATLSIYARSCGENSRVLSAWRKLSFERNNERFLRHRRQDSLHSFFKPLTALSIERQDHDYEFSYINDDRFQQQEDNCSFTSPLTAATECKEASKVASTEFKEDHQNDQFKNEIRGAQWARNSCAFDTVMTLLFYMWKALKQDEQLSFAEDLPKTGVIFKALDATNGSKNGWATAKEAYNSMFFSEYKGLTQFQVNLFYSVESVYNHLLNIERQHGQLVTQESFTIDKRNSVTCSDEYCTLENLPQNSYELEALLLDTPSIIMDEKGFTIQDRIKHLMLDKWKLSKCSCGKGTKILSNCVITRTPLLLYISCAEILSSRDDPIIDPSITIMGFNYDLVAVGYGDGTHFTGTFSYGGAAYEYDGCRNSGLCRLMNSEDSPFVFEPKAGSYSYKRTPTILWYKRGHVEIV